MKRILMTIILLMINQLGFNHTEKRLRHSIIPTISLAGHALDKPVLAQFFAKVRTSILDTSIRMENNTFTRLSASNGWFQCAYDHSRA